MKVCSRYSIVMICNQLFAIKFHFIVYNLKKLEELLKLSIQYNFKQTISKFFFYSINIINCQMKKLLLYLQSMKKKKKRE